MQILHITHKICLALLLMLPFYVFASEKKILEINSVSESINKQYTRQELFTFPQYDIKTKLPWTLQVHTYSGPYLKDVLKSSKTKGRWLTLEALDYYNVSFNLQTIEKFNPILALKKDGKWMSIRSKGDRKSVV